MRNLHQLGILVLKHWTTQGQILPISIETFEIDSKLLSTPKTLKNLVVQYKNKKKILEIKGQKEIEETKKNSKFGSFLKSFLVDVLLFTAALITMIIMVIVINMLCRQ